MRKKTMLKRFVVMVLALAMVFSTAITAMAANNNEPPYTITIKPNDNTDTSVGNRYKAYQIFKGDITKTGTGAYNPGESTHKPPVNANLANIGWGTGIGDKAAFVEELLRDNTVLKPAGDSAAVTVKSLFETALANFGSGDGKTAYTDDACAVAIAAVLANCDPSYQGALAAAFAKDAGKHLNTDAGVESKINGGDSDKYWTIGGENGELKGGYYLIDDTLTTTQKGDAVSDFIMGVFGDETITVKSDAPTVDKEILDPGANGNKKGDAAGIGDTVKFKLKGTLPENYGSYKEYKYVFHDTLSTGITYKTGSAKVYVKAKDGNIYLLDAGNNYYSIQEPGNGREGKLDITFANLKNVVKGKKVDAIGETPGAAETDIELDASSEIYVVYEATINENAVTGAPDSGERNYNEVYLEYSNDPNGDGTGTTTEKKVYEYDFGLDITKQDKDGKKLEDAGFVLTRQIPNPNGSDPATITQYATFKTVGNKIKLVEWVTYTGDIKNVSDPAISAKPGSSAGALLSTDAQGHFSVEGLDEGTYTLTEVVTPPGYDTMDPIVFTIKPTIDGNGNLTGLEVTVNGRKLNDVTNTGANFKTGLVSMTLINYPAPSLPGTGGMGTTIFYVLGGLLLLGAVVYLMISGRKRARR